ncbi:alcohol dehydrogenase catalytic domain-containing protein [Niveibacterium terrae]|uniref:alcohol dehydrogenase catalytic domain-containing protein n=1 Tax=Niveibacterium terrae TaxID=3373598 RepID=UPI003A959849
MTRCAHELLPESFKAWTWQRGSDPRALAIKDLPLARPEPGEVLVCNEAIGLNPVDWKVLGMPGWRADHVPGVDGAGVVVGVGEGVAATWLGQPVAYHQSLQRNGSYAQFVNIPARALLRRPSGLDALTAASFPCPGLTAWMALEKLPAGKGRRLLLGGAGGAVGHYLVQLAQERGFAVTTMSHPRHHSRLRALGACECLPGPLAEGQSWPEREAGFAAVIDTIGAEHAARLAGALLANGHLVCIQGRVPQWPCAAFGRALSLHEVALGALHQFGTDAAWAELGAAGEALLARLADGTLKPEALIVDDFDSLAQRLSDLRARNFSGKPVIHIGSASNFKSERQS